VPQEEQSTPGRVLLYVASLIVVLVGGTQFLIGPWFDSLYIENWQRVPIWMVDIADVARLFLGPTAVALAYGLTRRAVHANRTELGLTRPRERMQAVLGVLCVVAGFGMFSSFWIAQYDPSVEPLGLPVPSERTVPTEPTERPERPERTVTDSPRPSPTPEDLALTGPEEVRSAQADTKPVRAHPLLELFDEGRSELTMIVLILVVCLFAPIAEELLFRAVLFSWLRRRIGAFPAGVASTWLFTMIHLPIVRPTMLAPLALLGAGLCVLTWRNESVIPAMAVHVIVNSLAIAQGGGQVIQGLTVVASLGAMALVLRYLRGRYDAQLSPEHSATA
jgi:Type II CAAX prenyl endopeptidase Rce1-like